MVQRKLLSLLLLVMLLLEKNQACDKNACKIGLSATAGAWCGGFGGVSDAVVSAGCDPLGAFFTAGLACVGGITMKAIEGAACDGTKAGIEAGIYL